MLLWQCNWGCYGVRPGLLKPWPHAGPDSPRFGPLRETEMPGTPADALPPWHRGPSVHIATWVLPQMNSCDLCMASLALTAAASNHCCITRSGRATTGISPPVVLWAGTLPLHLRLHLPSSLHQRLCGLDPHICSSSHTMLLQRSCPVPVHLRQSATLLMHYSNCFQSTSL